MKKSNLLLCMLTGIAAFSACAELSHNVTTIINAEAVTKEAPHYPISEAKRGMEGWAQLSYVVEPDGSVSNILVENSSGRKSFENAAVNAVKHWRFTPAQENGKPIQQCQNTVQLDFMMNKQDSGVSRQFMSKYRKAQQALAKNDLQSAATLIDELKQLKKWRLREDGYLGLLTADYAAKTGDKKLQLSALRQALMIKDPNELKQHQQRLATLREILPLELSLNYLNDALATYDKMVEMDEFQPYQPQYQAVIEKVENFIAGDQPIVVDAEISDRLNWRHTLVRHSFTLTEVSGRLDKLDIRCANKRHVYSFAENNIWKLPEAWQKCSVYVQGEQQSKFKFVELSTNSI